MKKFKAIVLLSVMALGFVTYMAEGDTPAPQRPDFVSSQQTN